MILPDRHVSEKEERDAPALSAASEHKRRATSFALQHRVPRQDCADRSSNIYAQDSGFPPICLHRRLWTTINVVSRRIRDSAGVATTSDRARTTCLARSGATPRQSWCKKCIRNACELAASPRLYHPRCDRQFSVSPGAVKRFSHGLGAHSTGRQLPGPLPAILGGQSSCSRGESLTSASATPAKTRSASGGPLRRM